MTILDEFEVHLELQEISLYTKMQSKYDMISKIDLDLCEDMESFYDLKQHLDDYDEALNKWLRVNIILNKILVNINDSS